VLGYQRTSPASSDDLRNGGTLPAETIRTATVNDAAAIAAIYNHYVTSSTATFDTESKSVDDRAEWLRDRGPDYPVLVVERGGRVLGWGALSKWGTRCAYRHTVEISIYVAPDATGDGLGPALGEALAAQARSVGHHAVISQIVAGNEPSLKMAARLGFVEVGRLREVGRKFDRWLDVVEMELVLSGSPE